MARPNCKVAIKYHPEGIISVHSDYCGREERFYRLRPSDGENAVRLNCSVFAEAAKSMLCNYTEGMRVHAILDFWPKDKPVSMVTESAICLLMFDNDWPPVRMALPGALVQQLEFKANQCPVGTHRAVIAPEAVPYKDIVGHLAHVRLSKEIELAC
ncbi:MAG: hypothetical protein QW548_00880 [Candidatus Aenigmatarchaeota archaeon]